MTIPERWRVLREQWVERKGKSVRLVFIHSSFVHKVTSNKHYNKNRPEKCGKLEELLWENIGFCELWGNLTY